MNEQITNPQSLTSNLQHPTSILVTGGAGFIGSNLTEELLKRGNRVTVLDNFATGKIENLLPLIKIFGKQLTLIVGDIRKLEDCRKAVEGAEYVLHEAALGSVPRSINDPLTTNEVNISGFLNMLVASRDAGVKRFIFAASSSTYGDSQTLPKVEEHIGKPLSPYAVTKYVNELYADVFAKTYGMEYIGLRYFNVFGRRQDPNGAYAAVIPLFVKKLMQHESPIINGDGEYSRDFTYIDNVILMNLLAMETSNPEAVNQIYNTAYGEETSLNELVDYLKEFLSEYDPEIRKIVPVHGPNRRGDIPHSLASIEKAERLLGYRPKYSVKEGLKEAVAWYNECREFNKLRELNK
jgi:UDP-N-acetylglucosamine 4-epimerase